MKSDLHIGPAPSSTRQMVVAFDSSCGACRAVSERVAAASSGKITTLPLTHPDVTRWRQRAVPDGPWAPTLVEVTARGLHEERVRAWTGAAMVSPLVRHLGLRDALAVTRSLGQMRQQAHGDQESRTQARGVNRRAIFQMGAGVAAVGGILGGARTPAVASASPTTPRAAPTPTQVQASLARVLAHVDVVNVAPAGPLARLGAAASKAATSTSRVTAAREGYLHLEVARGSAEAGQVSQGVHEFPDGGTVTVTSIALSEREALTLEEYTPARNGITSEAVHVTFEGTTAHHDVYSTNGVLDTTVGQELETRGARDATAAACQGYPKDDPCGGCCLTGGRGAVMVKRCRSSDVFKCSVAAAACASCAGACGSGTGTAGCYVCLAGTCPTAFRQCCDRVTDSCSSSACSA